jgi:hypothetical protein
MLRRRVSVSITRSTWPSGSSQPQRLRRYLGNRLIDVDRPLLCIALVNRPPALRGFDLGDTWAWLRYRPALAAHPGLRLRQEWTDIDPHQKTVLSDEMGVGFVSYYLARRLDFRYFGNTAYVGNVLMPNVLWFRRRARRGPAKLPDFVAIGGDGCVNAVECKGSQTSFRALRAAMENGGPQKGNLGIPQSIRGTQIVGGLFVPQWGNDDTARLHFIDPPLKIPGILGDVEPHLFIMAVARIFLAKHFALLGFADLALRIATTPTLGLHGLSLAAELDQVSDTVDASGMLVRRVQHVALETDLEGLRPRSLPITVTATFPYSTILALSEPGALFRYLSGLATSRGEAWRFGSEANQTFAVSPLGLRLELSSG